MPILFILYHSSKGGIEPAKIVSKWTAAIFKQSGVSEEEWIQKHISLFNEILSK